MPGEGRHFGGGADLQWMQRVSAASADWNLQEAREGFAAFLQKRPPAWNVE